MFFLLALDSRIFLARRKLKVLGAFYQNKNTPTAPMWAIYGVWIYTKRRKTTVWRSIRLENWITDISIGMPTVHHRSAGNLTYPQKNEIRRPESRKHCYYTGIAAVIVDPRNPSSLRARFTSNVSEYWQSNSSIHSTYSASLDHSEREYRNHFVSILKYKRSLYFRSERCT